MSEATVFAQAAGVSAEASLPQWGQGSALHSARFLRIAREDGAGQAGIFVVSPQVREGAKDDIYLLPGQLGLRSGERVAVVATPVSVWAYRRSQLLTPQGGLVLAVLCVALLAAWIDGTLALGRLPGWTWWRFQASTLDTLAAVSMACKLVSPVLAFLLALWFRK